jgi:transposase InsO family protein
MMYPLVRELAAPDAPVRVPVAVTCRVLGFSTQAYYKWAARPVTDRDIADAFLTNALLDAHADDPTFGYRFLADVVRDHGHRASDHRVWRLCRDHGLTSAISRRRARSRRPGPPVHDDQVNRDFTARGPNEKWLTDITEHPTRDGKLYLCAVKDCWSNRIVGYSLGPRMTSDLAVTALHNAVALRSTGATRDGDAKKDMTIVHSDRGSQFRSRAYVTALTTHQLRGSMGRVATCADNSAMESFFALLQKNVLDRQAWDTRDDLRLAIITWIERDYHRRRRQRALGRLTPIEYETIYTAAPAA